MLYAVEFIDPLPPKVCDVIYGRPQKTAYRVSDDEEEEDRLVHCVNPFRSDLGHEVARRFLDGDILFWKFETFVSFYFFFDLDFLQLLFYYSDNSWLISDMKLTFSCLIQTLYFIRQLFEGQPD